MRLSWQRTGGSRSDTVRQPPVSSHPTNTPAATHTASDWALPACARIAPLARFTAGAAAPAPAGPCGVALKAFHALLACFFAPAGTRLGGAASLPLPLLDAALLLLLRACGRQRGERSG